MKNRILMLVLLVSATFLSSEIKAQAFPGKGSKNLSITVGVANYIHFGGFYGGGGFGLGYFFTPALSFNGNFEFGISKYVGLSPSVGIASTFYGGATGVHIPIGIQGNFHFFQLIADKTNNDIHADKLDVYAGVNTGGGPEFIIDGSGAAAGGFFYVGPQVGVRYYPKSNLGLTAEIGYGKTIANVGVTFNMGGAK